MALVGLLGVASFATVAPLQLRVLEKAGPAGQNLASSLNIAAFNLGNALGAWAGGVDRSRPRPAALRWVAACSRALASRSRSEPDGSTGATPLPNRCLTH